MSPVSDSAVRTPSVEDYLKNTYKLSRDVAQIKPAELAARLDVSPPSVTAMVKRLVKNGLMTHVPYGGVALTGEGRSAALEMIRRHRLLETFLVEALGYTWDEVDEEAERLEHAISAKMTERIAHYLGHPDVDPHGAPIPSANGEMPVVRYSYLSELPEGTSFIIRRVSDKDAEFLRYCDRLNLRPGIAARVIDIAPYGGSVTLRLVCEEMENNAISIGQEAAGRIRVESTQEGSFG